MNANTETENRIIDTLPLSKGSHNSPSEGVCVMEWLTLVKGAPFADSLPCVSPVVRYLLIGLNDRWSDTERQQLKSYGLRALGTNEENVEQERRRAFVCADYAVRVLAPLALEARGFSDKATTLRALPPIVDSESALKGKKASYAADAAYADAAYAYAYAADAAYAYADAAYAYAADAAYAAAYAYAAYAYAYAAARKPVIEASLQMLDAVIAVR